MSTDIERMKGDFNRQEKEAEKQNKALLAMCDKLKKRADDLRDAAKKMRIEIDKRNTKYMGLLQKNHTLELDMKKPK